MARLVGPAALGGAEVAVSDDAVPALLNQGYTLAERAESSKPAAKRAQAKRPASAKDEDTTDK